LPIKGWFGRTESILFFQEIEPMTTSLQPKNVVVPMFARRAFLRQSILACAATGLISQTEVLAFGQTQDTVGQGSSVQGKADPATPLLTRSTFMRFLSENFITATNNGDPVVLLLLEINDLPTQAKLFAGGRLPEAEVKRLREESFSLIFRGPADWPLVQRAHNLKHPKLGTIELFLVPIGKVERDAVTRLYEAVFNRVQ
jgi:hypothetical protein